MIISIEGIDGSGKGTQIDMLANRMKFQRKRYPDRDGVFGELFVNVLKKKVNFELGGESLFPMFLMDMLKDRDELKEYKGNGGKHVVVDRYVHSTLAYQCAQGFDYEKGKRVIEGFGLPKPDVAVIIDIDPDESIRRLKGGTELFERVYFLKKVRENYMRVFKDRFFAGRMHMVDGAGTPKDVHMAIVAAIKG